MMEVSKILERKNILNDNVIENIDSLIDELESKPGKSVLNSPAITEATNKRKRMIDELKALKKEVEELRKEKQKKEQYRKEQEKRRAEELRKEREKQAQEKKNLKE